MTLHHHPKGYLYLRVNGDDADREAYLPIHRLVALAHGEIEQLGEPVDVHHVDGIPERNAPENLEALDPIDHAAISGSRSRPRSRRRA
jgi:hypothetical protein